MIEDTYKAGRWLRRWSLIGGHPMCHLDALDTTQASPAEIAATLAENARIRALLEPVLAFEAAQLLLASTQEEPPATVAGEDGPVPNPAHAQWIAAQETVAQATAETLELAARRRGENAPEGEPFLRALVRAGVVERVVYADHDWTPLIEDGEPWEVIPLEQPVEVGSSWDGGGFVPPAPAVPVPASVARWRARAALRLAKLLDEVEAAVAVSDVATQEWWAAGLELERADPRVMALAQVLGLKGAQVDDLFRKAASL